jgi:hypothetical protein
VAHTPLRRDSAKHQALPRAGRHGTLIALSSMLPMSVAFWRNVMANTNQPNQNSGRGFASMDPQKQREISAEGGRSAHQSGNAHEFNSSEAKAAGSNRGQQQQQQNPQNQQHNQNQQSPQQQQQQNSNSSQQVGGNTRGGSSEQHAKAGSQSHKNR